MKKLEKLTLNEMQDFVPLSPQEQMAMKGGSMTPYQWVYVIYTAWKISQEISSAISGSGSQSSPSSSGSGIIKVYGPDSVVTANGIKIYYPDSLSLGSGN